MTVSLVVQIPLLTSPFESLCLRGRACLQSLDRASMWTTYCILRHVKYTYGRRVTFVIELKCLNNII